MTRLPRTSATNDQIVRRAQKYCSNHIYNIHNQMNKNTDVTMTQW